MARIANHRFRKPFRKIVAEELPANAGRLMSKARNFSRLAKVVRRRSGRRLAYRWKSRHLRQLPEKCGEVTRVRHDASHPDWGIRVVKVEGMPGGLHTHSRWLEDAA